LFSPEVYLQWLKAIRCQIPGVSNDDKGSEVGVLCDNRLPVADRTFNSSYDDYISS
jgi:hypothetical protein